MPPARHLTIESVNFDKSEEVNAFLDQVLHEGTKRVQAEGAKLQAEGLMDADGKLLITELPPDMCEGSERDFGG